MNFLEILDLSQDLQFSDKKKKIMIRNHVIKYYFKVILKVSQSSLDL